MSAAPAEIRIGAELASAPYLLDAAAAKAYHDGIELPARRRPRANIHDDQDAARKAGFTAPIVRGGRIEVALTRPVLCGDTLTSHAKIVAMDADRAQLEIDVENQRGEKVLTGTA